MATDLPGTWAVPWRDGFKLLPIYDSILSQIPKSHDDRRFVFGFIHDMRSLRYGGGHSLGADGQWQKPRRLDALF